MPMQYSEIISPRETIQHDWEVEAWDKQAKHDLDKSRMQIELTKLELRMKQEDRLASRKHQEQMKEMETEIRAYEVHWQQLLRIPIVLLKLPVAIIFAIAYCIAIAKGNEIKQVDYWKFLR